MALFTPAFQKLIVNEGTYSHDKDDEGGETYKGIARNFWPKWEGWAIIDEKKTHPNFPILLEVDEDLQDMVKWFYKLNFWDKVKGDQLNSQEVAFSIFDFAVNAGDRTAITLAQRAIGVADDGIIGNITLSTLNLFNNERFLDRFDLEKIKEYIDLVDKKPVKVKYFFGWVKRVLKH